MSTHTQHTVVVGIDGTEDGQRALTYGVELARREDLDLRLVHVAHETEMFAPMMPYLPEPQVLQIGHTVLRDALQLAEEAGFDAARTTSVLTHGLRTSAVLDHLDGARCLVVGTRASGLQHLFTGSTTLSMAARAAVPVHSVPRSWSTTSGSHDRVVAGLDGSRADVDVLEEAFREARSRGATNLRFLHAWRPVSPYDAAITRRTLSEDWENAARETLTKQIDEVAGRHPGIGWQLELDFERVTVALHRAVGDADVLVLGRHSHIPPEGLGIGSNTRTLIRTATCPVVVVPITTVHAG